LLTGMTGNFLHMQWPLTSQSHHNRTWGTKGMPDHPQKGFSWTYVCTYVSCDASTSIFEFADNFSARNNSNFARKNYIYYWYCFPYILSANQQMDVGSITRKIT
jgi:hypothetical protein